MEVGTKVKVLDLHTGLIHVVTVANCYDNAGEFSTSPPVVDPPYKDECLFFWKQDDRNASGRFQHIKEPTELQVAQARIAELEAENELLKQNCATLVDVMLELVGIT